MAFPGLGPSKSVKVRLRGRCESPSYRSPKWHSLAWDPQKMVLGDWDPKKWFWPPPKGSGSLKVDLEPWNTGKTWPRGSYFFEVVLIFEIHREVHALWSM